ncbi:hypothetical protein FNV43_RR18049 [Rhamnella rubrinervis]|uniref:TF-B3 domain-containing protein n=1 Tax=Rhamnella rubrinervis TaxID=2594499 RepID=A0A8K0E3T8_9ROSA|nr:hypothetical protein FNV43_RR18049 [Rhamnella rubrinervis]
MEFGVQELQREYSDKEEEEEEYEVRDNMTTTKLPLSSSCSSSSGQGHSAHQWLRRFEGSQEDQLAAPAAEATTTNFSKLIDLSLKSSDEESSEGGRGGWSCIEREHMFDKVVTPSDVGKLNRLVIPKQHAEKYFPLDSSANEKGLLLNFEDRTGKPWRFRYSYWNSSQSYVMTKGWSRFVKEKKLDAGDVVSFERGVGDSGKNCLYIDWRRRPYAPPNPTSLLAPLQLHQADHYHHHQPRFPQSVRWAGRLYSLPPSASMPSMPLRHHEQHHLQYQPSYNNIHHPYNRHHHHQYQYPNHQQYHNGLGSGTVHDDYNFLRSSSGAPHHEVVQRGGNIVPVVIESIPVHVRHVTNTPPAPPQESKRLRLFGVNMEYSCPIQEGPDCHSLLMPSSSTSTAIPDHVTMAPQSFHLPSLQVRLPANAAVPTTPSMIPIPAEFPKKGKSASLSFSLDP